MNEIATKYAVGDCVYIFDSTKRGNILATYVIRVITTPGDVTTYILELGNILLETDVYPTEEAINLAGLARSVDVLGGFLRKLEGNYKSKGANLDADTVAISDPDSGHYKLVKGMPEFFPNDIVHTSRLRADAYGVELVANRILKYLKRLK